MKFISMVLLSSSLALGCSSSSDDHADWPKNIGCRALYGLDGDGWTGPGDCSDGLDHWSKWGVDMQVQAGHTTKSAEALASESYALLAARATDSTHFFFEPRPFPFGSHGGYWFAWYDSGRATCLYFLVEHGVLVETSITTGGFSEAESAKMLSSIRVL
ncbi:hypothetical protein LZC95_33830 [Pendulispora brunnea]|uniref:DUF3558 domain-containing protein n=1 Tax=Pendulispora brunnea TaxID=2905690 RepID=A0ABZ2JY52_9BACT